MKSFFISLVLTFAFLNPNLKSQDLGQTYIEEWKQFYPSRAMARGIHSAIFSYEDFSKGKIQAWSKFNRTTLDQLSKSNYALQNPIDARLLKVQLQSEINKWQKETPHLNSLSFYATPIASAINRVLGSDFLTTPEKNQLICERLKSVQQLCVAAIGNLKQVNKADAERSIRTLQRAENLYRENLTEMNNAGELSSTCDDLANQILTTTRRIQSLVDYVNTKLLPAATEASPLLGRDEYARRLSLYTDSDLTPEKLADIALEEIGQVRKLIGEVSQSYLKSAYPNRSLPDDIGELTQLALRDMEKDAPINAADYLEFWQELKVAAVDFIKEHKIATLPKNETLQIKTAPESAGAAARIGWVSSAPPFDPNPMTTLYLPSIPETLPKQEQIDFWASFNKPFNRMIVIHELLPGHYMQMKISRETPHPIRLLFPYGIYTEGWATFTERVLLDAGWEKDNPLTFLAHLRKRIENANRAYTSVQVHTNGWTQQQVMEFSTNTSLVAPQFAKSLWGRIMRSPMQLTSYFLGGAQFTELMASEKVRLGDQFDLTLFMDTIMKSGPITIDEFKKIFSQTITK